MNRDFDQIEPDSKLKHDLQVLIRLGLVEDLDNGTDLTSASVIAEGVTGQCSLRSRVVGLTAGVVTIPWILEVVADSVNFQPAIEDGQPMVAGQSLGVLSGPVRDLLTAERLVLNVVSRCCGVATLTSKYVAELKGLPCRLYDTRKTTTGWRRLEKYSVRCGGGFNHRTGLFDAFLIKDNHLALGGGAVGASSSRTPLAPSVAVERAKAFQPTVPRIIEIEVDSLAQFEDVISSSPDIILLDNFSLDDLAAAVDRRNQVSPEIQLEASGGITLASIRKIAMTGVDRISCGAITHQATWLDLGLDWIG